MERKSRIERKTNEEVHGTVYNNKKIKRATVDAIGVRRLKMVGHALERPGEMHYLRRG